MLTFRVLIIVLLSVYLNNARSQELRPRAVEAGFSAGPAICWATPKTDAYKSTGVKMGGYYGIVADINLLRTKEFFYLSTGIAFKHIRFGLDYTDKYFLAKKNETIDTARITSAYNTIFFTIPTAIKLKTERFSNFAIFGIAGLEHGFRLSAKSNDEIIRLDDDTGEKANKVNQIKNIVLLKESIFAVIGVEYGILNRSKLTFGLGYNYGLNSIFKQKYKNEITEDRVIANIHTIEFQFGFIF
jgi:hypothetical protein